MMTFKIFLKLILINLFLATAALAGGIYQCNNVTKGYHCDETTVVTFEVFNSNYYPQGPNYFNYINKSGYFQGDMLYIDITEGQNHFCFYYPIDGSPKADYIVAQIMDFKKNQNVRELHIEWRNCSENATEDIHGIWANTVIHMITYSQLK